MQLVLSKSIYWCGSYPVVVYDLSKKDVFALPNTNIPLPIVLVNIPFPVVLVTESTMLASAQKSEYSQNSSNCNGEYQPAGEACVAVITTDVR